MSLISHSMKFSAVPTLPKTGGSSDDDIPYVDIDPKDQQAAANDLDALAQSDASVVPEAHAAHKLAQSSSDDSDSQPKRGWFG